jgi:2'-5' RNA ligase
VVNTKPLPSTMVSPVRHIHQTVRLFLALWPDASVRSQLDAHVKQWNFPPGCVRYLPKDWHLTLHFLGNIDRDHVADILLGVAVPLQPCTLVLDQATIWPHGLAVLTASKVPDSLHAFHAQLAESLRRLDLPVDARPYLPHVTLARRAGAATAPIGWPPVVWTVRNYVLVASGGNGDQRYKLIHRYSAAR